MPRGEHFYAFHRTGGTYRKRPPANRIAARAAWDYFAASGPVEWLQLLDGFWGCKRPNAEIVEEVDAVAFRRSHG